VKLCREVRIHTKAALADNDVAAVTFPCATNVETDREK
jgi:hypothetical protein